MSVGLHACRTRLHTEMSPCFSANRKSCVCALRIARIAPGKEHFVHSGLRFVICSLIARHMLASCLVQNSACVLKRPHRGSTQAVRRIAPCRRDSRRMFRPWSTSVLCMPPSLSQLPATHLAVAGRRCRDNFAMCRAKHVQCCRPCSACLRRISHLWAGVAPASDGATVR